VDARKLEHFVAVAETLNFTRAAHKLHVAQPSLSQSIKQLERELKVPLFLRLPSGLQLTEAGRELLTPATLALRSVKDAYGAVRGLVGLEGGTLDVVAPHPLITHPTADLVAAFRQRYPGVKVVLREADDSLDAAQKVASGVSEVCIHELSQKVPGIIRVRISSYSLFAVYPPGTELTSGEDSPPELQWTELRGHDLIALAPQSVTRRVLDEHGLGDCVAVEVHSAEAAVRLVLLGVGAAVMVEPYALLASESGARLRRLDLVADRPVGLGVRDGAVAPAVKAFVEICQERESLARTYAVDD
jgi:DNA-binding transcriptional LysR family regulator